MTATACAALLVGVALLASWAARPVRSESGPAVYSVRLVWFDGVYRSLLQVDVMAGSRSEAVEAARLVNGAGRTEPAGASAAWQPWSWKWSPSEIPVPVAYNPTGAAPGVGPEVVLAGLQAWSSVPDSSFRYRYAGVTNNAASILDFGPDGENVVSWAPLPCEHGCVLAVTSKLDGHEVDMVLNSNPEAAEQLGVGTKVDWRTVILHEFGHMAGLEHSCPAPFGPCTAAESDAVMYFQYRGVLRKLAADDMAGLAARYPLAASTPPPSGTPPSGASPTPTPFPEMTVILEQGWNLVVLPAGPVAEVAATLPCLEALYSYANESWSAWIRGIPAPLQGFSQLAVNRAYWAYTTTTCAHVFP